MTEYRSHHADAETDVDRTRAIRGSVYLARLRLNRLEGAWPDIRRRTQTQRIAIGQARRALAEVERRAREENVPT